MTSPALEKHFTEVADASPIPVVLYRWHDHHHHDEQQRQQHHNKQHEHHDHIQHVSVSLQTLQLTYQWLQ